MGGPPCSPRGGGGRGRGRSPLSPNQQLLLQPKAERPRDGGTGRTQTHSASLPRPRASRPGWWVGASPAAEGLAEPRVRVGLESRAIAPCNPREEEAPPNPEQVGVGAKNRETLPTETPTLGSHRGPVAQGWEGLGQAPAVVGRWVRPPLPPGLQASLPSESGHPHTPTVGHPDPRAALPAPVRTEWAERSCSSQHGVHRSP